MYHDDKQYLTKNICKYTRKEVQQQESEKALQTLQPQHSSARYNFSENSLTLIKIGFCNVSRDSKTVSRDIHCNSR